MSEKMSQQDSAERELSGRSSDDADSAVASRRQLLMGGAAAAAAAMVSLRSAVASAAAPIAKPPLPPGSTIAQALLHIEIVHSDPESVFTFLRDCLGATKVETKISALGAQVYDSPCIHAKVGDVVFQIVNPSPKVFPSWYDELQRRGPCVHNVTFYVNDIDAVTKKMLEHGATTIRDNLEPSNPEIGVGGKSGSDRVVVLDARKQTGLRIEMCEPVEGWPPGGVVP